VVVHRKKNTESAVSATPPARKSSAKQTFSKASQIAKKPKK
jgi:hypothetical protein